MQQEWKDITCHRGSFDLFPTEEKQSQRQYWCTMFKHLVYSFAPVPYIGPYIPYIIMGRMPM